MKKTIGKKEYDTENAEVVKRIFHSHFGDPAGYEEILYRTPDGFYFIYVCGGQDSPYPKADIQRLAKDKVDAWLESRT